MRRLLTLLLCIGASQALESGCRWRQGLVNQVLDGHDTKFITGVTAEECKTYCENEDNFQCRSFDYFDEGEGSCWLSWADSYHSKIVGSEQGTYYEILCNSEPRNKKRCPLLGPIIGFHLPNNNLIKVENATVEDCERECRQETSFHCSSFDYNMVEFYCYLQIIDRNDNVNLEAMENFQYFELNCELEGCPRGIWQGPTPQQGISSNNRKIVENSTIDECKTMCKSEKTFQCRSFEHFAGACYLQSVTSVDIPLSHQAGSAYYELTGCETVSAQTITPIHCFCVGDPHCFSFDGYPLDFMGTCKYTFSRDNCENSLPDGDPSWEVIINNNLNYPMQDVAEVHDIRVALHAYSLNIDLHKGMLVQINDVSVLGFPRKPNEHVTIMRTMTAVHVTVDNGIQVVWDGKSFLEVRMPPSQRGKTCGLCGNADNDPYNDWTVGDSDVCMDHFPDAIPGSKTTDVNEFGFSWTHATDSSENSCKEQCNNSPPNPRTCSAKNGKRAENHCNIIRDPNGPFSVCLSKMTEMMRARFFYNCVYDSCHLNNHETVVCEHAAALSRVCLDEFYAKIAWRKDDFCPMTCGEGMVYRTCGRVCLPTCGNRLADDCGDDDRCEEGCFCEEGLVFDGTSKCMDPLKCGCLVPSQDVYIEVGESFLDNDCSRLCTCNTPGGDLECEDHKCISNRVCANQDGVHGCFCNPPYVLDGTQCINIHNPCEAFGIDAKLQCFTCNETNEAECTANGRWEACAEPEPMCETLSESTKNGRVISYSRQCKSKDKCSHQSLGPDGQDCSESQHSFICAQCNYGEQDEGYVCELPDPSSVCVLFYDEGIGGRALTRYYFDAKLNACVEFMYRGEGGNGNNFTSKDKCQTTCADANVPNACQLLPDPGPCKDFKKRYFFDAKKNRCRVFQYGGCEGNSNNFVDQKDCTYLCKGQ